MKFFPDFDFYVAIIIYLFEGVNLIYDNLLFLLKIFICYFLLVLTSFFLFLLLNFQLLLELVLHSHYHQSYHSNKNQQ